MEYAHGAESSRSEKKWLVASDERLDGGEFGRACGKSRFIHSPLRRRERREEKAANIGPERIKSPTSARSFLQDFTDLNAAAGEIQFLCPQALPS